MYYSYIEIEYVATSFSPARTDLALKLLSVSTMASSSVLLTLYLHCATESFRLKYKIGLLS
jgi:hypothetical protein